jgi:UDP-2,4-diacetamido-2,4,6-trideoxy-beta-L-altropyranose hydrolase
MRVLVRVDASRALGGGHVMRQLALAGALRDAGAEVQFACRAADGMASRLIGAQGFTTHPLASGLDDIRATRQAAAGTVDWVVVDHYELGAAWETGARSFARRVLAVDDLADRAHDADLLVDQNYYNGLEGRYAGLVPQTCERLLGPAYALLRPEFAAARAGVNRDGPVRRILVSFGATDPLGHTPVALEGLQRLKANALVIDTPRQSDRMARLMAAADLAIGSGGVSTNERMCLGLPAAVVATHPFQEASARDVGAIGAHRFLGPAASVDAEGYARAVAELMSDPVGLRRMSDEGMRRVDGLGARRVADRMLDA